MNNPILKTTGYKHTNLSKVDIEKNNRDYAEYMNKMYGINLSEYLNTGNETKLMQTNTNNRIQLRQRNTSDVLSRNSVDSSILDENDSRSGKKY